MANEKGRTPVMGTDQAQGDVNQRASGDWMGEDSTTGDGHPPRDRSRMFQQDWQQRYSGMGGTYDDYAPAYDYGSRIGSRDDWRGKGWNDIENDARSGWENDRPGTWEKFKDAVRYAWDQITGSDTSRHQRR
jgi:hypothetical protein